MTLDKGHRFSRWPGGFKCSELLTEQVLYVGQLQAYGQASELLEVLTGARVSDSTIYRMVSHYGQAIEEELYQEPELEAEAGDPQEQVVYAQLDGSMLFTDDSWQEVKVGRVFQAADIEHDADGDRGGKIERSAYAALLGGCREFTPRLDAQIRPWVEAGYRLVFISDGAVWIRKWMERCYPEAEQILDLFHVCDQLGQFAKAVAGEGIADPGQWVREQKRALLEGELEQLLDRIEGLPLRRAESSKRRDKLLHYLQENSYRMDYRSYRQEGLMVGSGAIEAAHRTLVQQRMKLSGQRWSDEGANNLLNLRVCKMSGKWPLLIRHIKRENEPETKS